MSSACPAFFLARDGDYAHGNAAAVAIFIGAARCLLRLREAVQMGEVRLTRERQALGNGKRQPAARPTPRGRLDNNMDISAEPREAFQ